MARVATDAIERAQGIAQSGSIELISAEEAKLLNKLVSAHSEGKLTDRDAAVGIGTIAALRAIKVRLNKALNEGIYAGKQLTQR